MKKIQASILKRQYRASDQLFKETLGILIEKATSSLNTAISLATEKGASSWVMARPLHEFGTVLHEIFRMRFSFAMGGSPLVCSRNVLVEPLSMWRMPKPV
jgi:hypothetical protein